MKDTYISARLIAPNVIRISIYSMQDFEKTNVTLVKDHHIVATLIPAKITSFQYMSLVDFNLEADLELGHSYYLTCQPYGIIPLDVSEATNFPHFDEYYGYEGNDLGYTYNEKSTLFKLWAPLASRVDLIYKPAGDEKWHSVKMARMGNGVYGLEVSGHLDGTLYHYEVVNSETMRVATDPYAKASTENGRHSVVVDFDKLKTDFHEDNLPVMNSPTDAIICEGHVRDLTISSYTNIEHKGTFLGLCEKGRVTKGGLPAGFDYFKSLGFTHFQLLPIYDYKSVDENDPSSKYNWGYDPAQYFVPEGSYASSLHDPLSRIRDLKQMVASYHEAGIRIVMDVVYNHVYDYQNSSFEKIVPNYYFRHRPNDKISNCSGCGDDFATERKMVRKLIVDCCKWWISNYGIDGFRFDLMGLIDLETLKQIEKYAKSVKKDFLLYGEGWNMYSSDKFLLGNMNNAKELPNFGFFNDFYREACKGFTYGNMDQRAAFKAALAGSCIDFIYPKKFIDASQSINYVECHDNKTIFDNIRDALPDESVEESLERVNFANACVCFGYGIPFYHAGCEIGQSKWDEDNTYNKGDYYNKFSYRLLEERKEMVEYFKAILKLRKSLNFLHIYDPRVLDQLCDLQDCYDGIRMRYINDNITAPYQGVEFLFNPSNYEMNLHFESPVKVLFGKDGKASSEPSTADIRVPARHLYIISK